MESRTPAQPTVWFAKKLLSDMIASGRDVNLSIDALVMILEKHFRPEQLASLSERDLFTAIERILYPDASDDEIVN